MRGPAEPVSYGPNRRRVSAEMSQLLLVLADVVAVLKDILPRRTVTNEEIFRQLEERHKRRKAATDSAYRKQFEKEQLARYKIM